MLGAKAADFLILKDKKRWPKKKGSHFSPLRKRTRQFSVNVYDVTAF